ncbi:MAG: hypothetical protein ABFS10_05130 [Bacteroidota bacterium]
MERDPQISKLVREDGVVHAPEGFTGAVMDRITTEPEKRAYKPLIGWGGRVLIPLFITVIVVLSIIFSEPGGEITNLVELPKLQWQLPEVEIDLSFLSGIEISTGMLSVVVAIFILVLSDVRIRSHRGLSQP